MNNYDKWKTKEAPLMNSVCAYCGEIIEEDKDFCDDNCRNGFKRDLE